jgi:hypothetical protein
MAKQALANKVSRDVGGAKMEEGADGAKRSWGDAACSDASLRF